MTKNHITKKYKSLLKKVETDDFYTKIDLTIRVNCYTCQFCNRITKTKDIDSGVTPFIHSCAYCNGFAHSSMYNDLAPHLKPVEEWYRPSLEETLKLSPGSLDHVLQGGLLNRKIQ